MSTSTATMEILLEELNQAAEYAGLPSYFTFTSETTSPSQGEVRCGSDVYLVDIAWAIGNAKRLPDKCTASQMVQALMVSHPDVKGVGPK